MISDYGHALVPLSAAAHSAMSSGSSSEALQRVLSIWISEKQAVVEVVPLKGVGVVIGHILLIELKLWLTIFMST